MTEDQHTEWKSSWRDDCLKWLCGTPEPWIDFEARDVWVESPLRKDRLGLLARR